MTMDSDLSPSPRATSGSEQSASEAAYVRRRDRRRSLLGPGFWLAMAFGVVCVIAGAAVTRYGPQLFKPVGPPPMIDAAPAYSLPAPSVGAGVPQTALQPAGPSVPPVQTSAPDAAVFALGQRVGTLEADVHRQSGAAAAALAAATLQQAAQTSRPFDGELSAVEPLLPDTTDLRALHRLAQTGAPTRAALAAGFSAVAARAAVAARTPGREAGLLAEALHALTSIVTIRRVDQTTGSGSDAVLARAERLIYDGELDAALKTLDALPKDAQDSMASWRVGLERRAEIDRRISGVRASALRELSLASSRGAAQ